MILDPQPLEQMDVVKAHLSMGVLMDYAKNMNLKRIVILETYHPALVVPPLYLLCDTSTHLYYQNSMLSMGVAQLTFVILYNQGSIRQLSYHVQFALLLLVP